MDLFRNSLWGDSNLHSQQQSSPLSKHQTQVSDSGSFQKKHPGSISQSISRSQRKQLEQPQKFIDAFLSQNQDKWRKQWTKARASSGKTRVREAQGRPAMSCKVNHCKSTVHCLLVSTHTLSRYYTFSQAFAPGKHHRPFHQTASRKQSCLFSAKHTLIKQFPEWAGEVTQQLQGLPALSGVLSLIPSNPMVAHNHLQWDRMPSSAVSAESNTALIIKK